MPPPQTTPADGIEFGRPEEGYTVDRVFMDHIPKRIPPRGMEAARHGRRDLGTPDRRYRAAVAQADGCQPQGGAERERAARDERRPAR